MTAHNRQRTIDLFDKHWNAHGGFSLKSEGTHSTPFLETFVDALKSNFQDLDKIKVIEAGAGCGSHSVHIAKSLNTIHVVALETSHTAQQEITNFFESSGIIERLTSIREDVYTYVSKLLLSGDNITHAFYANSVFHFFSEEERKYILNAIYKIMPPGGILAISYKKRGDFLEKDGEFIEQKCEGCLVKGKDGIIRLFVDNPQSLMKELRDIGFYVEDKDLCEWSIMGYNKLGEEGKFIGFIARKNTPKNMLGLNK